MRCKMPSAFTILLGLTIVVYIATLVIPGVQSAAFSELVMAPFSGVIAAIDIALFVLIIGGFLGVVKETKALDAGVTTLVVWLKDKKFVLIPVLMFTFSLGGTTFGMAEETLPFYALITMTMVKMGFTPMVAVGTIMLGAGVGVLGSTVNPFTVGVAVSAAASVGVVVNQATIMKIGGALWLSTVAVSIIYVMRYAKKVYKEPQGSLVKEESETVDFTKKRKLTLALFAFTFLVMVVSVIPWYDFGINIFDFTAFLTGSPLGKWWFPEFSTWFFLMAVAIGVIYGLKEKEIVGSFIAGAAGLVDVALIIGVSQGISFLMVSTGLDMYILESASQALSGTTGVVFTLMTYIIYILLTVLIPSTVGVVTVSMPVFLPLADRLDIAPELVIGAFLAGSGITNLVTPTFGVVVGGLAIAKVEWLEWAKFASTALILIFLTSIVILAVSSVLLSGLMP